MRASQQVHCHSAQVWFSLQGEMSATVMYYPQQYVELMEVMRARLLQGRPDSWAPNVKIGLQMNYNKLCACVTEDAIHPDFETSLAKVEHLRVDPDVSDVVNPGSWTVQLVQLGTRLLMPAQPAS